jgi:FkbM family methyltransferase
VQAALAAVGGGDIRGWSCWDLGAHFGLYSVGLSLRVGSGGQVAAFEPNPPSFARLERHRRMNRLAQLKVFQAAVSDREGTADLLTYGDLGSTSAHLAYDGELGAGGAPIPVDTVRLDALVEAGRIRVPNLVKVDVEGHGHRALAGARRSLAAARPILMVAFHSEPEAAGVLGLLEPLGYDCSEIAPVSGGSSRSRVGGDFLFTPR